MATFEEVFEKSLEYFDGDELAANVFVTKYALSDNEGNILEETPDKMHLRLAKEFARIEKKYDNPMKEAEIYDLLKDFKYIVPQGSPMSGIGNNFRTQSISNCFVIDSPADSYGGILKADQEQVQIMKRRGGVGFDISTIRPKGLRTKNAAKTTDGIGIFMERFSNSCREVAQGGRRGALMLTLSCHHPDIDTFIKIKRDLKKVTGANISLRITDEFMNAVEKGEKYQQRFPVEKDACHTVSEWIDAREVWQQIIESAHQSAEPGILFWDNILNYTPAQIYEDEGYGITSTNPCSELVLSPYDSCRLLLLNVTSFVNDRFTEKSKFDYALFAKKTRQAQRLMDDMVDLEIECVDKILAKIDTDPEPDNTKLVERNLWNKIKDAALGGRRTGLGMTGIGDAIAMLDLKYGDKSAQKEIEKITKTLALSAYRESCNLAKERGPFSIYNFQKERGNAFIERLFSADPELRSLHEKYGRRNIALTTIAPCGSVSVETQTTSGIEPAFMLKYTRRKKLTENDTSARVDFVDDLGDKWQEFDVYHHGIKTWMDVTGETDIESSPYAGATAMEIGWEAGVDMQAAAQKWICHSISKTCNLPNSATVEDVDKIYRAGWKKGLKGMTVYRDGSRTGVLIDSDDKHNKEEKFVMHEAPKRPEELSCHIHNITIKGEDWTMLVGLMDNRPYEIMGGLQKYIEIPKKYKSATLIKHSYKTKNSRYDLRIGKNGDIILVKDVVAVFDNPNHAGFTRTISLALRHGAAINYVVEQLQKDREMDMFSFSKVIARVLKNYIRDGTTASEKKCESCSAEDSLHYQEGCVTCISCGWSRCS
jgi:ribonucleoside-diphosphate reductase alpha chain